MDIFLLAPTIAILFTINLVEGRIITSLDSIQLVTDAEYVISNATIRYFGKSHFKYVVDSDQTILRDIPDFWVSVQCFNVFCLD